MDPSASHSFFLTLVFMVVGVTRLLKSFHYLYIFANEGINVHWLQNSLIPLVK